MLRDMLTQFQGVCTWPCDEINYIWRHGNIWFEGDNFTADMVTDKFRKYIDRQFQWVARRYNAGIVIEKTCANSLRVEFVEKALDGPKYIFICRNGIDATASAMRRWRADLDLPYILSKARFVPVGDIPFYATQYLLNRMRRLLSRDGRVATWGPMTPELKSFAGHSDLAELCAMQWKACLERSLDAFDAIPEDRILRLSYENLIKDTREQVKKIVDFLDIDVDPRVCDTLTGKINASSVGKGYRQLPNEVVLRLTRHIGPTMERLGYE
jgi:hypothetical protein